ncbi:MAG: hypothetical protein GF416_02940 [Candidatus Altiarchaeales archaeon]|nr:hypothetical protein [Candidatus Altiarchaeales archaeon]MBD3416076.1 hypothetical protein [Candidatus Altiarchaeales archaeon]
MALRRRVLSDEQLRRLEGLEGVERRRVFEDLKELRKRVGYGDQHVESLRMLTLPSDESLDKGLETGTLDFRTPGGETVKIPVETDKGTLVMPFTGRTHYHCSYYALRFDKKDGSIRVRGCRESLEWAMGFISARGKDLGHMYLDPSLRKTGVLMPALRIARDHAMAHQGEARVGFLPDDVRDRFLDLFERLGFRKDSEGPIFDTYGYHGQPDPRNDLTTHYRMVGVDPETGRRASKYREKKAR